MIKEHNFKTLIVYTVLSVAIVGFGFYSVINKPEIGADEPLIIIQPELLLKAPKEKIVKNKEVDWIVKKEDGTFENKGKIISYDYISDKKVNKNIVWDNDPYSAVERLKTKENGAIDKFYSGDHFYKDGKDTYEIEHGATTTPENWKEKTKVSWINKLLGRDAFADTDTFYSGSADGSLQKYAGTNTWDAVHDATTADSETTGDITYVQSYYEDPGGGNHFVIGATYVSFNTSVIGSGSTISSSSINWNVSATGANTNSDYDYIGVTESSMSDPTSLVFGDYNKRGFIEGTDSGERVDITGITTGWRTQDLNATGKGWISKTGWTKLNLLMGNDIQDVAPALGYNYIGISTSETAYDPYLLVEWTEAPPVEDKQWIREVIKLE